MRTLFDAYYKERVHHTSIHLIPKCQKIHNSFVFMLIGPHCLDRMFRIKKNLWLKTRHIGKRIMYFSAILEEGVHS